MNPLDESLARSLSADTTELIPHLPYLLQDCFELGSSPETIVDLLLRNVPMDRNVRVLDLACGKGAVSLALAKTFSCRVTGIDLMSEFVNEADTRAKNEGLDDRCLFRVGDIREECKRLESFDVVVYGAVGDVLGTPEQTLRALSNLVKQGGWLVLDDAYALDESDPAYLTRNQWRSLAAEIGFDMTEDIVVTQDELDQVNDFQQACIAKRAEELKARYPKLRQLFDDYVKSQLAEVDELNEAIDGVTMLFRRVR